MANESGDDARLVGEALAGDADAYGELVSRYQGHVYGLAYSIVGNWSDAQDIAQETFIRVHMNLDQLRDPARFAPWLRRVAFSVTMNWLRAYRPQRFEQLDSQVDLDTLEVPDFTPGPGEVVERKELANAVTQALASLPPKYRVPITMFHLNGLSYQKVADFLDIPLGTAKSLIHRAREKLKPALAAYLTEEVTPMVKEVLDEHRLPDDFASKIIHGLEKVRWGAGERENSPMGALAAALQAAGEDVSYEFLMGVSGAAFRLQMMQGDWCPSAPHPRCGFNCFETAMAALDWDIEDIPAPKDDPNAVARVKAAVKESIDAGMPAFYTSLEESLIVGYQNDGDRLLLRLYGADREGYRPWWLDRSRVEQDDQVPDSFLFDWPHLTFGVLRHKDDRPDRGAALVRSLALASELSHAPEFDNYVSGFAAYSYWIDGLRDEARFADPDKREAAMHANAHCYYSLCDAREAAAGYLREVADELEGEAALHVARAAELYAHLADEVLTRNCSTEVAPMRWKLGDQSWTQAMRAAQASILEEALDVEREAIGALEAASAALAS